MTDSIYQSPLAAARRHETLIAGLQNLREGEDFLLLEQYLVTRYGARRAAVRLMMMARQLEIAPWTGEELK